MGKRIRSVSALVAMCGLGILLLNCGSSSSRPEGLLYVTSQSSNNISSFSIDLNDGNLSLINANAHTCNTLPAVGCGVSVSMVLDPTKATAFVLNAGIAPNIASAPVAPTIYGYTVNSDGSLSSAVVSATLPSGDSSVAMTENAAGTLLFVIDQGSNPSPSDCTVQPNSNADCPSIQVFNAMPGSTTLSPASVFHLDRTPTSLSVLTSSLLNTNNCPSQTLLFMTSNVDLSGLNNDNELSVFCVDSSGNVTEQGASPYMTAPNPVAVQAVNTNAPPQKAGGIFAYVGNRGSVSGSIGAFQACTTVGLQGSGGTSCTVANNQLIPIGSPTAAGDDPVAMLVDPTNSFLYVASNTGSNEVYAFNISTGTGLLTQIDAMPSQGTGPFALAMHTSTNTNYNFLYVSNLGSSYIGGFTASTNIGTLSSPTPTLFQQDQPSAMAAK